jgi:AraC-like DNA-binding protein
MPFALARQTCCIATMLSPARPRGGSAARIVLRLVELAAAHGHEPQQLCHAVGVSWHVLQNPDATIATDAVERLSLYVAELVGDPDVGLRLARRPDESAQLDPGFLMMMACSSLQESLERMERMQTYWSDGTRLQLLPLPDGMCLRHDQPGAPGELSRLSDEAALAKIARGVRALIGAEAHPRIVRFRHARPADTREHAALFACELCFGAPHTELELSTELLQRPLPHANETYRKIFQRQVEHALARLPARSGLAADVREAAQAALSRGRCSLAATARVMGIGARSLQRKLQAEGTSFAELIEALRRELAQVYLAQNVPIQEIAWQLGYKTPSAFHNAFKRWTGKTPSSMRAAGS